MERWFGYRLIFVRLVIHIRMCQVALVPFDFGNWYKIETREWWVVFHSANKLHWFYFKQFDEFFKWFLNFENNSSNLLGFASIWRVFRATFEFKNNSSNWLAFAPFSLWWCNLTNFSGDFWILKITRQIDLVLLQFNEFFTQFSNLKKYSSNWLFLPNFF